MALTNDHTFATKYSMDVCVRGCYIKVKSTLTTKTSGTANVVFLSAPDGEQLEERPYLFAYDIAGDNPIRQAYLHLKTLPEFANAVDC